MSILLDTNILGRFVQPENSIERFQQIFPPLRDERGILERWQQLVVVHEVQTKKTHDARLVAATQRHRIDGLLAFNVADFKRYEDILLLDPEQQASWAI